MQVAIVGAGISGLTVAACLLERGVIPHIVCAESPERTVSAVAAAVWFPYRAAPHDKVASWGATTLDRFQRLADIEGAGVRLRPGLIFTRSVDPPWWAVDALTVRQHVGQRPSWSGGGWEITAPVIDMRVYLPWLAERVRAGGGTTEVAWIDDLTHVEADIIVNCTGLGARALIGDLSVRPVRGQVIVTEDPGLERFTLDEDHPEGSRTSSRAVEIACSAVPRRKTRGISHPMRPPSDGSSNAAVCWSRACGRSRSSIARSVFVRKDRRSV